MWRVDYYTDVHALLDGSRKWLHVFIELHRSIITYIWLRYRVEHLDRACCGGQAGSY